VHRVNVPVHMLFEPLSGVLGAAAEFLRQHQPHLQSGQPRTDLLLYHAAAAVSATHQRRYRECNAVAQHTIFPLTLSSKWKGTDARYTAVVRHHTGNPRTMSTMYSTSTVVRFTPGRGGGNEGGASAASVGSAGMFTTKARVIF